MLVQTRAAALNNTDIWTREGAYGLPGEPDARAGWRGPLSFPLIQGGDIAGVITEAGAGVDADRVGQRVLVDPAIYLDDSPTAPPVGLLGSEADGGFAEFVTVTGAQAHDVTDSPLTDEQLAALPVSYGTAMGMLERAGIAEGENVVVTGASGGVGLALVQLAAARGANVTAVTSGSKATQVLAAGARHTVDRGSGALAEQIENHTRGKVDAVADIAGGALVSELLPLVRDNGRWVIAGAVAGPVVEFDLRRLYLHNISLIGSSMHTRGHFAALLGTARSGAVQPVIAARFPLDEIAEAQEYFSRGDYVGKIVINLN
ncbi:alcohol dehydrogenase [Corynebacterium halotolerans YIM 70093 = DSM 44683]|uniref:Alcohol dehydrogenase n=1 Tax=Corynebacterium halotolerans YIM 70093 = DSM 44683 TaxID=1121362 RepID=M1NXP1_9CORY|nr:alcohol dehydrogenase [Corynebacterium halotolerans YIM 70093 = DSM 44683]